MERLEKLNEIYSRRLNDQFELQKQQKAENEILKKSVMALEPRIRKMFSIYKLLLEMDVDLTPLNVSQLRIEYVARDSEIKLLCNNMAANRYIYLYIKRNNFGVLTWDVYDGDNDFLTAILDNIDEYEKRINDLADKFIEREEKAYNEKAKSRTYYVQAVFKVEAVSEDDAIDNMLNCGERTVLRVD